MVLKINNRIIEQTGTKMVNNEFTSSAQKKAGRQVTRNIIRVAIGIYSVQFGML